ncbi:MAG TPA: CpXC domain-containing protein, partial [Polyangia bacterium]
MPSPDGHDLRAERGGGRRDSAAAAPALPQPYTGQAGQTRLEAVHYSCPCGAVFPARVHRVVNATRDPGLGARVRTGTLNQVVCPECARAAEISVSVIYHDQDERRFILVLPESARTREMWERAELWRLLAEDAAAFVPDYVRSPEVVYGRDGLLKALEGAAGAPPVAAAALLAREALLEDRVRELDEREAALAGREGALAVQKREIADGRAEIARHRKEGDVRAEEAAKRERTLLRREEAQARREAETNEREARLRDRETRLAERELEQSAREAQLREREQELEHTGPVVKLPLAPMPAGSGATIAPSPVPLAGVVRAAPVAAAPVEEPPRRTTLVMAAVAPVPPAAPATPEPEVATGDSAGVPE